MSQYHVACSRPGLHRGGRENPAFASYDPGDHTPEQLQALLDDPTITVVVGIVLEAEHIPHLMPPSPEPEPEPAGADKADKAGKADKPAKG